MRFAVIVQARMGSTRLRGKVLEPLGRRTALARCLERCSRIEGLDELVCAIPHADADRPVAEEAARCGARIVRGSAGDVLSRYGDAARAARADVVMRVTSDCPLIDPDVCAVVRGALDASDVLYAANNLRTSFPHGLDCDVFPAERLYRAEREATDPYDREHVTPWLRRQRDGGQASVEWDGAPAADLRWTLDYPGDLAFFRALFELAGEAVAGWPWREIMAFCRQHPQLQAFNAAHMDDGRLAASGRDLAPAALQQRLVA